MNRRALGTESVTFGYGAHAVVKDVSVEFAAQAVTSIVGPNGCGKSTFLRGLAGVSAPMAGRVLLDGRDLAGQRARATARSVGFLPQNLAAPQHITVRELVSHGRDPHRRWFDPWTVADTAAVDEALAVTDLTAMAEQAVDELSGGQRQRAWIALTLAQSPDVLVLDEPTTFLDIAHQLDVLELISTLVRERGTTVVMVLHDLTMAARYSDYVVALRAGQVVAHGPPAAVFVPDLLADVFGIEADVTRRDDGSIVVVPIGRVSRR